MNATDVERDVVVEVPDVRRRHRDVLGEAAITVDTDDLGVGTHVCVACAAEQTSPVDDVALGRDAIAFAHIGDKCADLHDVTSELMTNDEWRRASAACPSVPFVDVNVGAANPSATNANQDLVLTDLRLRDVSECESGPGGFLYERFHARSAPFVVIRRRRGDASTTQRANRNLASLRGRWKSPSA